MSRFLQQFQQKVALRKSMLHGFLKKLQDEPPAHLDEYAEQLEPAVWAETPCLQCANCCRTMTPTFTVEDMKRIATHFRLSVPAFKKKWLYQNKKGEWRNRSQPCQFLDMDTNKCTIYSIRPADCAGFPHLTKKKMVEYLHVHKQNIEYCPATFKLIEKLSQIESSL